jgi:hypothetical protein
VVYFPEVSPPRPCIRLSSHPHALHAPPISFFSILSPEQYWVTRKTANTQNNYSVKSLSVPRSNRLSTFRNRALEIPGWDQRCQK